MPQDAATPSAAVVTLHLKTRVLDAPTEIRDTPKVILNNPKVINIINPLN